MKLSNQLIYTYAYGLAQAFNDQNLILPIKVNFYLQKNKMELMKLAQEIEAQRDEMVKRFGSYSEETMSFYIPEENQELIRKEFNDLMNLEQDVKIYKIKPTAFSEDLNLTMGQMEALMFMIEE